MGRKPPKGTGIKTLISLGEIQWQKLFTEVLDVNPDDQMKQIAEAKELFNEILHVNPHDKVAQIYYQRCEQIEQYGVAEEWAGVWSWINTLKKGNDIMRK